MRHYALLGFLLLVTLVGCTAAPQPQWLEPLLETRDIPYEQKWAAVVSAATDWTPKIETIDGASGYIITGWKVTKKCWRWHWMLIGSYGACRIEQIAIRVKSRDPFIIEMRDEIKIFNDNRWITTSNASAAFGSIAQNLNRTIGRVEDETDRKVP